MPYLPSPPLPVPDSMPPVSEEVVSVGLENLGIVTEEEEQSNQQLYYKVFISEPAGQPARRAGHMTPEATNTMLLQAALREEWTLSHCDGPACPHGWVQQCLCWSSSG